MARGLGGSRVTLQRRLGRGGGSAAAPPAAELAWASPNAVMNYYTVPNASSPQGALVMTYYFVFQFVEAPASNIMLGGKSMTTAQTSGFRYIITTAGALQYRAGTGSANVNGSTKSLTPGSYYIVHTRANGTNFRSFADGTMYGIDVAFAAYGTNTDDFSIGAESDAGSSVGSSVRIVGCGLTDVAMSDGQVTDHVAAIKAALKCSAPGVGTTEYNWSAEDAGATWIDEGQGATASRTGADWTYGTEASPAWGS